MISGSTAALIFLFPAAQAATDDGEALRAQRMAEDRLRYEAYEKAVAAYGHVDEFAAKVESMLDTAKDRFIATSDGFLTDVSCQYWLAWNVPAKGETQVPAWDFTSKDHPFRAIVDLNRELRAHGIDFLLVSFPTRTQLYPELFMELPTMEGFAGFCPATPRFVLELMKNDVEVLYLAQEFAEQRYGTGGDTHDQLYLRYNQHWAPRGAELAAKHTAERLAKFPWFKPGSAKEGVDWIVRENDVSVNIAFGGSPPGAKPERFRVHQVVRPDRRKIDYVRPSSPITLLSGSFADFHKVGDCDFTSQLFRYTGWPIDKVNPKGGIEDACREELAARRPEDMKKKKIVVWMLPEMAFRPGPMWRPVPIFE